MCPISASHTLRQTGSAIICVCFPTQQVMLQLEANSEAIALVGTKPISSASIETIFIQVLCVRITLIITSVDAFPFRAGIPRPR
ncbi:MAG: hypothetical protein EDM74_08565 [Armatimonadetes bacterium]|nr:MAG: hypothetical protein EDM74_08565 [Armatimonadota bacterium]